MVTCLQLRMSIITLETNLQHGGILQYTLIYVPTSPSSLISCCFFGLTWRLNRWSTPLTCDGFASLESWGLFLGSVGSDKAWAVAANASRDKG